MVLCSCSFNELNLFHGSKQRITVYKFPAQMNAETNATNWIDSSSAQVRSDYKKNFELRKEKNEAFFKQLGIDAAFFEVGDHVYLPLLQLFKRRK